MTSRRELYLVDGMALAYRAFYAFAKADLRTQDGFPTGAVFGFTKELIDLLEKKKPSHIGVAWDAPGETVRHKLFESYKAHRPETPPDLLAQIPYIQKIVEALQIPFIMQEGYEADDIIATLAKKAAEKGFWVYIFSHDKDLMQLLSERIRLLSFHPYSGLVEYSPRDVERKFGVSPSKMRDFLALTGDTSDNIPGVPGIGPKTAQKLLKEWESVENLLKHLEEVKPERVKKLLEKHRERLLLSYQLVEIHEVELDVSLEELRWAPPIPRKAVEDLFERLEFRSLWRKVQPWLSQEEIEEEWSVFWIQEEKDWEKLRKKIKKEKAFALYGRWQGEGREAKLLELQVGFPTHLYQIPWKSSYVPYLKKLLEEEKPKISFHWKAFGHALANEGIELTPPLFDLMLGFYLLHPGRSSEPSWEEVSQFTLGRSPEPVQGDLFSVSTAPSVARDYWLSWKKLEKELKEGQLIKVLKDLEQPLIPVLLHMERRGILVDPKVLKDLEKELKEKAEKRKKEIYEEAGEEFNIQSPKALQRILFEKLALHKKLGVKLKKTKTGYSTNQEVLESLSEHPLPRKILVFREITKLLSTYIRPLVQWIHPETKRIHTTFHQALTATGRLSSSRPNLQNIPIRSELGEKIREAFIAPEGFLLLSADYSQIELRILAHFSKDPTLLQAFSKDEDIHRITASKIFGVPPQKVTPSMRAQAKVINYGIIYGMGVQKLARELGVSQKEAKAFREQYFASYPKIRSYLKEQIEQAEKEGKVFTLLGRCRFLTGMKSAHAGFRAEMERIAVNTPIQGSAADIIKLAMIQVFPLLKEFGAFLLLQIHDELLFEVPEEQAKAFGEKVRQVMEEVYPLSVPLKVRIGLGRHWREAH